MSNMSSKSEAGIDRDRDQVVDLPSSKRFLRGLGVILIALALLVTLYGAVTYTAWQRGQKLRVLNAQQALQEELARQTQLAREDIRAGNQALAVRRLEWVLSHADTDEKEDMACDALIFKTNVLWAQLDALYLAYVDPGMVPPGAFVPDQA